MNYPIDQLSPDSKIWVFLCSDVLSDEYKRNITISASLFLDDWTSHQQALKAGVTVLHNRFLIFSVDESMNSAAGCSVDKLFKFVKELGIQFNCDFLNRLNVAIKSDDQVKSYSITEVEKEILEGRINKNTIVFNTLVDNLSKLQNNFEVSLQTTWLNRYLKEQHV